jgi:putative hydrolase of the HAD superfamily
LKTRKQAVFFDGDDTLWKTQPLYKSVIDEFYTILQQQGFDPEEFRPLFTSINRELLKKLKLSSGRLGRAMSGTYETMCKRARTRSQQSVNVRLGKLARQVYARAPEPMEHVHDVFSLLQKDFELFFYSAGVEETQRARLNKLKLAQYFQDRILIVTRKDAQKLSAILQLYSLDPETTWMVGNSPKFDVNPALTIGLNCIWMHTSFWKQELEDISTSRIYGAFSLDEVANILLFENGFGTQAYTPSTDEAKETRSILLRISKAEDVWMVGTSPRFDINPALDVGANPIWIPTAFDIDDIEPFNGSMFVAFSREGAREIIRQRSGGNLKTSKVIWRLREKTGDKGGSLIVD